MKVRILDTYRIFRNYWGKIGEVTSEEETYYTVLMEDGQTIAPYKPGTKHSQCEIVEETPEDSPWCIQGSSELRKYFKEKYSVDFHLGGDCSNFYYYKGDTGE